MAREISSQAFSHKPTISESFKYHEPVHIERTQENFIECKIEPTDSLEVSPYEFVISPVSDTFLVLNNMTMYVKFKVRRGNGDGMVAGTDAVAPCNNLLSSMWKNIECKVNNSIIGVEASKEIAYKSMLETLLSYEDVYKQHIYTSLFHKDTAGEMETMLVGGGGGDNEPTVNKGFHRRYFQTFASIDMEMCGPICVDFLRSDNHLAPGNTLTLTFEKANDAFLLSTTQPGIRYKIEILELAIYCRRVQMGESAINKLVDPRRHQRYLTSYTEIKPYSIIAGVRIFNERIFDREVIPKQVIVAMVDSSTRVGAYDSNPFNFKHYGLNSINLKLNDELIPTNPLKPDFDKKLVMREYHHLFANTGKMLSSSRGMIIGLEDFLDGYSIFPFDLTPDRCNSFHTHVGKVGNLDLQMSWKTPLAKGVDVLVYFSMDQIITINPISGDCKSSVF